MNSTMNKTEGEKNDQMYIFNMNVVIVSIVVHLLLDASHKLLP